MPEPLQAVRLQVTQIAQAAEALTGAFMTDPVYAALLPDPAARERSMRGMWRALIAYCRTYGAVYTTPAAQGAACWFAPGRPQVTLWGTLRTGFALPRALMQFPPDARRGFFAIDGMLSREHKRLMPRPHWYLAALGVAPACQGQGIGGALIAPVLAEADAAGLPCYLETMTEPNVAFYERRGFAVVGKGVLQGIPYWAMVRQPRG